MIATEEIEEVNVAPDHVHIFLSFPPEYSIAHVVGVLKSISAAKGVGERRMFGRGYFARTVGDRVTADLIKRDIKYHCDELHAKQLRLF